MEGLTDYLMMKKKKWEYKSELNLSGTSRHFGFLSCFSNNVATVKEKVTQRYAANPKITWCVPGRTKPFLTTSSNKNKWMHQTRRQGWGAQILDPPHLSASPVSTHQPSLIYLNFLNNNDMKKRAPHLNVWRPSYLSWARKLTKRPTSLKILYP